MNENTVVLERPASTNPKILTSPYAKEQLLNDIATKRVTDVAKQYNVSHPRISQIKAENKILIDQKKAELLKLIPNVVETVRDDVNTNSRLSKHIALNFTAVTSEQIALKNSLDKTNVNLLKIAGVIQPQALINYNLNQDNRTQTTVISDNVLGLFAPHAKELIEAEAIATNEDTTNE